MGAAVGQVEPAGPTNEPVPSLAEDAHTERGKRAATEAAAAMTDPVSWLQIEQGWNVLTSDGVVVGRVAQVEGDKQSDIFDGLAVESKQPTQIRYVPGEQVAAIYPGEVTLKIALADIGELEPFRPPPPETKWLPGKVPLTTRMSNWLRGKR